MLANRALVPTAQYIWWWRQLRCRIFDNAPQYNADPVRQRELLPVTAI
jgi:hypothetical protein